MVIRHLRKKLKPVIWVITVAFVASIIIIAVGSIGASSRKSKVAMLVGKEKVKEVTIRRGINNLLQSYKDYFKKDVDQDLIKMIAINSIIEQKYLFQKSKELSKKVSNKEIREKMDEQFKTIGKKEALRRLANIGFTELEYKKTIKEGLLVDTVKDMIKEEYKATDEEIKEYFEENKDSKYKDKKFDEIKDDVKKDINDQNKEKHYRNTIEKGIKDLYSSNKIVLKEEYKKLYEKFLRIDVIKVGNENFENMKFYNDVLFRKMYGNKEDKEVYESIIEGYRKSIAVAEEAKKRNLIVNTDKLARDDALAEYRKVLKQDIKDKYKYTDEDLNEFFKGKETRYEQKESLKSKFIHFKYDVNDADKKLIKEKAEKALEESKKDGFDFDKYAKENSNENEVDLGWVKKGQSSDKEVVDAAFLLKAGEISKELVKTENGYYIVKREDKSKTETEVKAKHILIKIEDNFTDEQKTQAETKAKDILKNALKGEKSFADLAKEFSEGPSKSSGGDLGWFGKGKMVPEFEKASFSGEVGKIYPDLVKTKFGYHIILIEDKKEKEKIDEIFVKKIFIKEKISKNRMLEKNEKADKLVKDILDKKIDFDKAMNENSELEFKEEIGPINKGGYIPKLGYKKDLNDLLFGIEKDLEKVTKLITDEGIYIAKLTEYKPFKEAVLEEVKEKVTKDYLEEKVNKELSDLEEELLEKVEVNVLEKKIETVLGYNKLPKEKKVEEKEEVKEEKKEDK